LASLKTRFGNLLAAHRKRRGLTQDGLASVSKLSVDTIKKLEAGRAGASFDAIERLAGALGVDPHALFTVEANFANERRPLVDLQAELSTMSDRDLEWVREVLAVARRRP
jgi:transcriptional regulator with XRE-family HTH domain